MNKINEYLQLDGKLLNILLTVLAQQSITRAAEALGMTQSAVSHALNRLREICHDELFIRAGRGIEPTSKAIEIAKDAQTVLDKLQAMTQHSDFDPAQTEFDYTILANDFQRDYLLPRLYQQLQPQVKHCRLHVISARYPSIDSLRQGNADMLIAPVRPAASDIFQKKLFANESACFYDASIRPAPQTWEDFRQARYVGVSFLSKKSLALEENQDTPAQPEDHDFFRQIEANTVIRVSNFSGIREFVKGTNLLALGPEKMRHQTLRGLACAPLPTASSPYHMYLMWHHRHHDNAAHRWFREQIYAVSQRLED